MKRKAVLFVDTRRRLDDALVASVKIHGVPLLKRILLDVRRARMEGAVVVLDRPDEAIEALIRGVKFPVSVVFSDHKGWRERLFKEVESGVVALTADRLYDFRLLAALSESTTSVHETIVAIELKDENAVYEAEQGYEAFDGRLMAANEMVENGRSAGAFVCSRTALERVIGQIPELDTAGALKDLENKALKFDIGNGFIQEINSADDVRRAEQRIFRYIWKETDGIHARWNKKLATPFIKLMLKTPLTPNAISLCGVIVSLAAGYCFWKGSYLYFIAGAGLAYVSAIFDHLDGSVARLKSMESAFGCYFEQFCDFVFYFSLAIGLTGGLFNTTGNPVYLALGGAFLFGTLMSLLTLTYHRREFAEEPSSYLGKAHRTLEANKQNALYRFGRKTYFVAKRPVLPYYLFILTVLNALPIVLFLAALGANLFWILQLFSSRLFRLSAQSKFSN